jgi:hypothetical protein
MPAETFSIEGFLLAGPEGWLRLLTGSIYVDLDERDLVEVEERPAPADLDPQAGVPVTLIVRQPCRIRTLADGRSLHEQLWDRPSPYAFASRATDESYRSPPEFRARERAYLADLEAFEGSLS